MADYTIGGFGSGHGFIVPGGKKIPFIEYSPLAWLRADMNVTLSGGYVQWWRDWVYPGRTTPVRNYYTADPVVRKMVLQVSPPSIEFTTINGQLIATTDLLVPYNWYHNPPFSIMCTYKRLGISDRRILVGGTNSYFTPYYPTGPTSRYHTFNPANNYTLDTTGPAPLGNRVSSVLAFDGTATTGDLRYYRNGAWQTTNTYASDGLPNRWEESFMGRNIYAEGDYGWIGHVSEIIWLPIAADDAIAARYESWSYSMWN